MTDARRPVLLIHGGAGPLRADTNLPASRAALLDALEVGMASLLAGAPALDAVVAAVARLEASGLFNAGRGAVLASDGSVSLDAAVMDGRGRRAGAVAALTGYDGAVVLARRVMERTPHVLLAGPGAEAFAAAEGLARASASPSALASPVSPDGTVGAVALDVRGDLASATSTGGLRGKRPGRVGDSPIVGAGTYADARCAVSATGEGELFVRAVFAHRIAVLVETGAPVAEASRRALDDVVSLGGAGGCIALAADGTWTMPFVTDSMFRGVADAASRQVAITAADGL